MKLIVDKKQRYAKMRTHTGIHLMYGAMEKILNRTDIKQAGSYVDEDYGRLDFSADKPLTQQEIKEIENLVNNWIYEAIDVDIFETTLNDAVNQGAKAFFDEKYGEKVRVIKIPGADIQLCGGTHCVNTYFVGAFKIIGQEAVASGIRRLVINTGPKVSIFAQEKENYINEIGKKLDSAPAQILSKIDKIQKELNLYKSEVENLKSSMVGDKLSNLEKKDGEFEYIIKLEDFPGVDFKTLTQKVKENLKGKILVYSEKGNFAIISDGTFSAKSFAQEKGLRGGGNDSIVQGRDIKILEII